MNAKDGLHRVENEFTDEQSGDDLPRLESTDGPAPAVGGRRNVPHSLGFGRSGHSDVSERVDEILGDGFGL
jgi:hypothetical protein